MIYTITTNPSLDYTVETELIPGQINRTDSEAIRRGVSVILSEGTKAPVFLRKGVCNDMKGKKYLGLLLAVLLFETRALGFAAGRIGQTIRDLLDDLGCPHEEGSQLRQVGLDQEGTARKALPQGLAAAFSDWLGSGELTMELMEQIRVEKSVL